MTVATAPVLEQPPAPTPLPSHHRRQVAWPTVAGLAGLVALAAALRLEGIGTWYWVDEALSVGIARHPLADIPHLLLRDGSPPLWYLLAHVWTSAFGSTAAATHALSLVFALAIVPVGWRAGRRLVDARTGWFAAALLAINPFVTYFARETRMYTLVALLGVVVAWTFVAAFVDGRARAHLAFAAALLALVYTHNWGLYTGVGCAAALVPLWLASTDRRSLVRRAAVAFGIVAVGYAPWLPTLRSQIRNTGAPWSYTPSARGVVSELAALFRDERVLVVLGIVAVVGLVPLISARRWTRDALMATSLVILVGVPVVIGWTLSHVEPSWATRYLAVVVGPLVLLLAMGLSRASGAGVAAIVIAGVLVLQPVTRLHGYPLPRDAKSNAHGVALDLGPRLRRDDLVVVAQPEAVPLLRLELGPSLAYADPTGRLADPTIMDWRGALDRLHAASFSADVAPLLDRLAVGQRVVLVEPGNEPKATDTTWISTFRAKGNEIEAELRRDRRFQLIGASAGSGLEYVTVDALLFERIS
ncbi:MAG: mannosyltransferase [Actinomycetota bacterium]